MRALSVLEVITVGFPFCAFKALVGLWLLGAGWVAPGAALLGLAGLDLAFNLVNLASLLARGARATSACSLSAAVRRLRRRPGVPEAAAADLGSALDVALSFALVAAMLGLGKLGELPPAHLQLWNAAVIFNVIGAGLGRLGDALQRLPPTRS